MVQDIKEKILKFWNGLSIYKKFLIVTLSIWPFISMIFLGEFSLRALLNGLLGDGVIISGYFLGTMDHHEKPMKKRS